MRHEHTEVEREREREREREVVRHEHTEVEREREVVRHEHTEVERETCPPEEGVVSSSKDPVQEEGDGERDGEEEHHQDPDQRGKVVSDCKTKSRADGLRYNSRGTELAGSVYEDSLSKHQHSSN